MKWMASDINTRVNDNSYLNPSLRIPKRMEENMVNGGTTVDTAGMVRVTNLL
jgi:hypothetical protein